MVKRICCLLGVGAILFAACAYTKPKMRNIQRAFPIDRPFEETWQAVIEVFAELNLPISNIEKASGLIGTDWISFRGQHNYEYCDCGEPGFPMVETDRQGKFNVYVKKTGAETCEVKINSVFEMTSAFRLTVKRTNCASTGKLEADIYKRVQEKLR